MNARAATPERIKIDQAVVILGVPMRTVQHLAANGKLPGAVKVGHCWTFDERRLRQWLAAEEARHLKKVSTRATASFGGASPLPAANTEEAYRRAIGLKPKSASQRGARN